MNVGSAVLSLYILLRGMDSTLLKVLQQAGSATHSAGGPETISFCNVYFFSSLICGLAVVVLDRTGLVANLSRLQSDDRLLLVLQSFSGFFLGPVAFYLALARLSVVEQTLLFSLTLPCTALAAHLLLREALPRSFAISAGLITIGLWLANNGNRQASSAAGSDMHGVVWALVGVLAFSISAVLNRLTAQRGLGVGLTVGVSSLAAAVVFGVIALSLFGPGHFFYLRLWWVLGLIGGYAIAITLGSQLSLMLAYARLGVLTVTFWSSLTIVVAIAAAHGVLKEPLQTNSVVGAAMIVAATAIYQRSHRAVGGTQAKPNKDI